MTTATLTQPLTRLFHRTARPRAGTPQQPVAPLVVTRAELAECTCPDACERDHGEE
jgi:hypothetical protein